MSVSWANAAESAKSCASNKIEQEGFCIVVLMVCHGDGLCMDAAAECLEIGITLFACCHLDAELVGRSILRGVEMLNVKRNVVGVAELTHKLLVAVAFFASQVKIAMHDVKMIGQLHEDVKEADGVGSSADSHKDRVSFVEECMQGYILFDFFDGIHFMIDESEV